MESLLHFLLVAFVVQLQQALKDFAASRFADGEADALLGFMEAVAEVEVIPSVSGSDCLIHFDVQCTESLDVVGGLFGIVETVVGSCDALQSSSHYVSPINRERKRSRNSCHLTRVCAEGNGQGLLEE